MKHCAFALPLVFAAAVSAQTPAGEVILPGDARVDGSIIRAATNAWRMTGVTPGGQRSDGGIWKDDITIVEERGRSIIRRNQLDVGPEGATTIITDVDRKTLTPIRSEVTTAGGAHRVWTFEADHVHASTTAAPKDGQTAQTKESDIAIKQPVFDFVGGMYGLLVTGFPLQKGFTAKFPVFDPRNGVAWASYTVIGRERVPAGKGRTVEAWTVEVQDPVRIDRMIFSLVKEPPYIIRLQDVGEGKVWTFDMM